MDENKDGLISSDDLYKFLSKRGVKICQNELLSFISLFDEDLDGLLNWNEFLFMILPSPSDYKYDLNQLKILENKYNNFYKHLPLAQRNEYTDNLIKQSNFITPNIQYMKKDFNGFTNILYQIIDYENQIENIRTQIVNDPNFNIIGLFSAFDKYNNNYISYMDFSDTLENLEIDNKNGILLFSKYDSNNSGRLTLDDFCKIFMPINKEISINKSNNKVEYSYIDNMDENLKHLLIQLISTLLEYCSFESTLQKWYERNQEEIFLCFDIIDKDKKGYLNENDFNLIFDNKLEIDDLLLIMEKIDSNKDGKITIDDLVNFFK